MFKSTESNGKIVYAMHADIKISNLYDAIYTIQLIFLSF